MKVSVKRKTTIKDIAVKAGVSSAAVSKALNNLSDISEETKTKIKRIAKELNYVPNLAAKAMRTNRTRNIGTIYRYDDNFPHSFFSKVLSSFCSCLQKEAYDLTYISPRMLNPTASYVEHCQMKGFEGLLLACVDFSDPEIIDVAHAGFPFVSIDHCYDSGVCVTSDNKSGMKDLLNYCYSQGHRKICFIHGQEGYVTQIRKKTFIKFINEKMLAAESYLIESEYYKVEKTLEIFKSLLRRSEKPTCVLFPDDYSAVYAMRYAKLNNISIPDEISIAGYDSSEVSTLIVPRLTTVEQDTTTIGNLAAKSLLQLVSKEISNMEITVPVTLITGETVKNINAKK